MSLSPKEEAVIQLIKEDPSYSNYFFNKVSDKKWFYALKKERYFVPEKVSSPEPANQAGYFTIPQWNVLSYLERISKQVNIPGNEEYIDELLKIIKDVSDYRDTSGKHLDNYRTWWYFVKIILNIPNERIPLDIINLIPVWLDSKFDTMLQGSDIATKLLPKFLSHNPTNKDIQKAEMIINSITATRPFPLNEEMAELFSKNEELKFVIKPYYLQEAFNKYSAIIGKICSKNVIDNLVEKIKALLKKEYSFVNLEIDNKLYFLVLMEDEANYVIKLVGGKIESLNEMLKDVSTNPESNNILGEFIIAQCNKYAFSETLFQKLNNVEILKKLEPELLTKLLKNLYRNFHDKGTYKSLYEESEYSLNEPLEMLTFIIKRIINSKAKNDIPVSKIILSDFLKDKYLYFQKMAVYVIGQNMENYGEMFWDLLDRDIGDSIIEENYFGDELKHLLQNLKSMTMEQKNKLRDKIEEGPKKYVPEEDTDKYISVWKQERYHALINDPFFKKLYDENKEITKVDVELHPAIGEAEFHEVLGISPLEKEQLLTMSNRDIVDYLSNFKAKDFWTGPSVDGLADYLKEIAREQPEKFTTGFSPFLNTGYFYIYRIILGIRDAWNSRKPVEWDKLLDFIKKYINRDEFWEDKYKIEDNHRNAGHEWVLGMIGELIQDGTKDDNWAFEEHLLPEAQEILLLIIDKLEAEEEKEITDTITHALNSTFGKIITALIYLALRIARLEDKEGEKKEIKWSNELKSKYEKVLVDGVIEAYTLLGKYMPNLLYIDKSWVEEKIKDFENIEKEHLWSAFVEGYLFPGKVYNETYKLMREHYSKGITYSFKDKHIEERIIEHVAVGYLRGVEEISKNSLFDIVLNNRKPTQLKVIIRFFWSRRNSFIKDGDISDTDSSENKKSRKRIIEFWEWLYKEYKDKDFLNEDDKRILSTFAILAVFLPQIDEENIKWLMLSAPYVFNDFDSSYFVEHLNQLKDKGSKIESARYVGMIFQEMLGNFIPDYNQDDVRSIVEYLYEVSDNETIDSANTICDIYARRGNELLRDIYEKYKGY